MLICPHHKERIRERKNMEGGREKEEKEKKKKKMRKKDE